MKLSFNLLCILFLLFFLFPYPSTAIFANHNLCLKDSIYNFDTIQGRIGDYFCNFTYYNHGKDPLYITNVETSCGCIYSIYSQDALLPGDSSVITFGLSTETKSFHFNHTIKIDYYQNDTVDFQICQITGYVIPRVNEY